MGIVFWSWLSRAPRTKEVFAKKWLANPKILVNFCKFGEANLPAYINKILTFWNTLDVL